MPSPWVRRTLTDARASGHAATRRVEPTLGDRIKADRPLDVAILNPACAYCGYEVAEGAIIILVQSAFGPTNLCRSCAADPALGACGHSRTCDCSEGVCS
jgi:hypothetical protein